MSIRVNGTVGYGQIGLDGSLGYTTPYANDRLVVPTALRADASISAHAPSEVEIELVEPCQIAGYTSPSFNGQPCQFWIEHHCLDELSRPCEATNFVALPPGKHRLTIGISNSRHGCHTAWLLRRLPSAPRLALVTAGAFPQIELASKLRYLFESAAAHGLFVNVLYVGQPYGNHFTRKIEQMAEAIAALPDLYDHVLYLDGLDCLVLADEAEIVEKLAGAVTIGAERCSWPATLPEWTDWWERHYPDYPERYAQAGMWGGPRSAVSNTLCKLIEFHYELKAGRCPDWFLVLGRPIANIWDDQFLWQAAIREGLINAQLDHTCELFAAMTCTSLDLTSEEWAEEGGRLVSRRYGTRPVAAHLSGHGKRALPLWAGFLRFGSQ